MPSERIRAWYFLSRFVYVWIEQFYVFRRKNSILFLTVIVVWHFHFTPFSSFTIILTSFMIFFYEINVFSTIVEIIANIIFTLICFISVLFWFISIFTFLYLCSIVVFFPIISLYSFLIPKSILPPLINTLIFYFFSIPFSIWFFPLFFLHNIHLLSCLFLPILFFWLFLPICLAFHFSISFFFTSLYSLLSLFP